MVDDRRSIATAAGAGNAAGRCSVSIGAALAEARRRAGLTVTQVSHQTGIRDTIITAIEGDDYSACGGELYARGYIRTIARVVGADPEPLIREYSAAQPAAQATTDDDAGAEPDKSTRMYDRVWLAWLAVVALVMGGLWFAALQYHARPRQPVTASSAGRTHPVAQRHSDQSRKALPATAAQSPSPGAVPAHALTPVSATAFSPYGNGQGDNNFLAQLAIDGHPATAWHTDWYTTARFGNLYPGTGLLVDMGRPVTITAAQVALGSARGARLQLRVGAAPALADLRPVAHAANAGGVVRMWLTTPAHGRYVLVWFTGLPPDPAGTFQVSVYGVRLEGRI
jgi:cytoskeletal protein RodZ